MKVNVRKVMVLVLLLCLTFPQILLAQEVKFELKKDYGIKEILIGNVGKRVALRLNGGEEMEGIVSSIGDHLVHISKLSKRDFYDALIRIDRIDAVIIRMRTN